jgi:3-deoxy-D-arabino-heptulosonate 7-phosphate (DAHP) synthase
MIEVHDEPEKALSDGFQAIRPAQLESLIRKLRQISGPLGFELP